MAGALRDVGLERLVPFLNDEEHDGGYWTSRFSPGEQQALIFARIFLQKPDVLMLDEATSSLDEISAVAMYRKILEKFPDITLISIVHHKEIIPFHDLHASIENKNLTVRTIASEAAPAAPAPDAP
jgi:vitamin B12/bleomycin/antimicrobial peptide transport system ATP-binding/permease protein